jgi:hypothetical protein
VNRPDIRAAVALFATTLAIFLASHIRQVADSNYSMLLSQSLLDHGTVMLDDYAIPGFDRTQPTGLKTENPLQLEVVNGHVYYWYPPGSSVLSIPYVALMNAIGISPTTADGTFNYLGEKLIQTRLAALLMAGLTVTIFFTARLVLPLGWSVVIALSSALGTQVWSTASRGLWSDTWGIFLLGFVVWMLLAQETGRSRLRPVLLASLMAWTYFVRPTFSVPIFAVTVYVLLFHRSLFLPYALTGAAWCAGFLVYSWHHFGHLLPSYYLLATWMTVDSMRVGLLGNLISPSRGLLVFVPLVAFVAYLLIRYARDLPAPRLAALSVSIVVLHLLAIAGFPIWWAGWCYGARFSTGLVPWFALLAILGIKARASSAERLAAAGHFGRRAELVVAGVLLAISVTLNGIGANSGAAAAWNARPVSVDEHPERIWDWRHPQFLAR